MFDVIGRQDPPAITHPGFYYGFVSVGLAWQVAFIVIARDPVRFRTMMIPAMLEKFGYGASFLVLYLQAAASCVGPGVWRSRCAVRRAVSACLLSNFRLDIFLSIFRFIRVVRESS